MGHFFTACLVNMSSTMLFATVLLFSLCSASFTKDFPENYKDFDEKVQPAEDNDHPYMTIHHGKCELQLDEALCDVVRGDLDVEDRIIVKDHMFGWPQGCFLYTTSTGKKVLFYNKYDTEKYCMHDGKPLTCFCGIMGADEGITDPKSTRI